MDLDKHASKQANKKTDFTVDLTWWGSLRLALITVTYYLHLYIDYVVVLMCNTGSNLYTERCMDAEVFPKCNTR